MSKKISHNDKMQKSQNNTLEKEQILRDIVRSIAIQFLTRYDSEQLLEQTEEIWKKYYEAKDGSPVHKELLLEFKKKIDEVSSIFEFDTFRALTLSVEKDYRPLAVQFVKQIIQEYDCKTPSEKALAEIAASGYVRYLSCTSVLTVVIQSSSWVSSQKNGFMAMLSKEADRAQRQFVTILITLKQLKSPSVELNVKATTAFIAQNQQVNATKNQISRIDENIEPK